MRLTSPMFSSLWGLGPLTLARHYWCKSKWNHITSWRTCTSLGLNIQNKNTYSAKLHEPFMYPFGELSSNHQVDWLTYILLCGGIPELMTTFIHPSFYPCSVVLSKSGTGLGSVLWCDQKHVCKYDAKEVLKAFVFFCFLLLSSVTTMRKSCLG